MLKVEYLVFNEQKAIKSVTAESFNHLLQSDPDLTILNNKITYKGFASNYSIESGKVENTENYYFHLSFSIDIKSDENIEKFTGLLRAVKSVLHLANKSPQTLYDGISLFYSQLAYPKIYEIENLMRKLITKFMLINAGVDWTKERVPEDVKKSINSENSEVTYLHNVDFIQLKAFLFSENYPIHKERLLQKLKTAQNLNDLNLEEVKSLIPISNWDKYFAAKVNYSKEQLIREWDELYRCRCQVAHNKSFSSEDLRIVDRTCESLKLVLQKAIESLSLITLSENQQNEVAEIVAGNQSLLRGEFVSSWLSLMDIIRKLAEDKLYTPGLANPQSSRKLFEDLAHLHAFKIITSDEYTLTMNLRDVRNQIVHNSKFIDEEKLPFFIAEVKRLAKLFDGYR